MYAFGMADSKRLSTVKADIGRMADGCRTDGGRMADGWQTDGGWSLAAAPEGACGGRSTCR